MRNSEIFDNFVKISQEKNLISNDSSDSKKKLEETGRADSLDADTIAKLYGNKVNAPKEMEYEKNIIEVAHPSPVVVAPAYDRLNGLVENDQERQNILLRLVNKTPNGLSTQKRYAEKELTLSLVRLANNFDNTNQDKLRKLADQCLMQLTQHKTKQSLKKEAALPFIPLAVATTIGVLYANQHLPAANEGVERNYQKLVAELDDFLNDNNSGMGLQGHEYDEELLSDVRQFKDRLADFMKFYGSLTDVLRQLERPKDAKELVEISKSPASDTVSQSANKLRQMSTNMLAFIDAVHNNFNSDFYKNRHIKSKGVVDSILEKDLFYGVSLKGGYKSLFADDFQDVVNAIIPFKDSISEVLKVMDNAKSIEKESEVKLTDIFEKAKEDFGGTGELSPPVK